MAELLRTEIGEEGGSERQSTHREDSMDNARTREQLLRTVASTNNMPAPNVTATSGHSGKTHPSAKSSEWDATFELVKEACDSMRISEERVSSLEGEIEQLYNQSRDDLKAMAQRLARAQDELNAANVRVAAAEARANDAESWLANINSAIRDGFEPFLRRSTLADRSTGDDEQR